VPSIGEGVFFGILKPHLIRVGELSFFTNAEVDDGVLEGYP
jgi:hypothetical protein